jgi:hypothetical protein
VVTHIFILAFRFHAFLFSVKNGDRGVMASLVKVEDDQSVIILPYSFYYYTLSVYSPKMPGKDEDVHPHATGPAKGLVDKHQDEQELVFWSAWVGSI